MKNHDRINNSNIHDVLELPRSPKITYPGALPITAKRAEIVDAIRRNSVVVVTGETGSGKTTQIPKMCLEAGRGMRGKIGCTQPRRVAAVMVAHRIAEEMGENIGMSVGYKIRFEDRGSRRQLIKIMTDGILLMEAQADPLLKAYDTIIVDEAHERSLNIDFILGILKSLLLRRSDLKVIITSATIDTRKFSAAFNDAPIIEVSGRMFPVEMRYSPITPEGGDEDASYVEAAVNTVVGLRAQGHRKDILIFMPTERDIRECCELLEGKKFPDCRILPLFARLSWSEQQRVFQPAGVQKIVVATNVAETSLTIPGIHCVIDTGLARVSEYNPRSRTTSLPVKPISKSSADQRKGRCGRVSDGLCIRLYDEDNFAGRPLYTQPEILRSNLAEVILRMLFLRLSEISSFPFIDRPNPRHIKDAVDLLVELGAAVDAAKQEGATAKTLALSQRGRLMARMPLDPRISRIVIEAKKHQCLDKITVIAAALSIQDPRERPAETEAEADRAQAFFKDPASDFVTLINIWSRFKKIQEEFRSRGHQRKFCREHYLSYRRMLEWEDVYDQIADIIAEQPFFRTPSEKKQTVPVYEALHKSILSGFLSNIAVKKEKNIYSATQGRQVMLFPGSGLFNKGGNWIVAAEMVETSRLFARTAANIESDWLEELGGSLCRYSYSEPHWEKNRGEVVAYEQVTLFGLIIVARRPVSFGRIDPEEAARIFVRNALVAGEIKIPPPFLVYNLDLIASVSRMEDKTRRHDLLAGEEMLAHFYESRLPSVYDARTLQKLIKEKGSDKFLRMREEDVLARAPDEAAIELYPDEVKIGGSVLPCTYLFDPSSAEDGVTITVPSMLLPSLPLEEIDWAVPGLLHRKITALVKGLPKEYRKRLQPLSQTCSIIAAEMKQQDGPLIAAMTKFIRQRFGAAIPYSAWSYNSADEHVKTRVAVINTEGSIVASTRDIRTLGGEIVEDVESKLFAEAQSKWEKKGLQEWIFDELPQVFYLGDDSSRAQGCAFPALVEDHDGVSLRLFKTQPEAEHAHRRGVAALYKIYFKDELKYLRKHIGLTGEIKIWAPYFAPVKEIEKSIVDRVMFDLFGRDVRRRSEFLELAKEMGAKIQDRGQEALQSLRPILQCYYETSTALTNLEKTHRANKPALNFISLIRSELERMLPRNFFNLCDAARLRHLPRYLRALRIRAERGLLHLEKAYQKENELKVIVAKFSDVIGNCQPYVSAAKRKALDEYSCMVEEYAVSLFAQELKTAFPVSRKRLEIKLQEIEEMI